MTDYISKYDKVFLIRNSRKYSAGDKHHGIHTELVENTLGDKAELVASTYADTPGVWWIIKYRYGRTNSVVTEEILNNYIKTVESANNENFDIDLAEDNSEDDFIKISRTISDIAIKCNKCNMSSNPNIVRMAKDLKTRLTEFYNCHAFKDGQLTMKGAMKYNRMVRDYIQLTQVS